MVDKPVTTLEWTNDVLTGDIIFSGRVSQHDLVTLNLDPIDRKVVSSPIEDCADFLQNMEIIFRRLKEHTT